MTEVKPYDPVSVRYSYTSGRDGLWWPWEHDEGCGEVSNERAAIAAHLRGGGYVTVKIATGQKIIVKAKPKA